MKKVLVSSLLSACAVAASAAPFITVGDQLDIFFRGAVIGNYNSNITYASQNKIDDYAGTLRLGGEMDYGRQSKFKANLKVHEDLTKYVDHKEFDSNLLHIAANTSYTEASWSVAAYFKFDQNRDNTSDTTVLAGNQGLLVRYNNWNAGVKGSYDFSEKIYGTVGFDWLRKEFVGSDNGRVWSDIYSSYDIYSLPVSLLYRVTQKIAVGLSYQYRHTDYFDGDPSYKALFGTERDDHFIGVTATGEIAPKLTCEVYIGAQNRSTPETMLRESEDSWSFTGNITLGYEVSEKLGVYVRGSRDFGGSATRENIIYTTVEGGLNYYFNPKVVGTASLTYQDGNYQSTDRTDHTIWTRVGVSYMPNKFFSFGVNYNYLNNESNVSYACYQQHIVSFNANLKY